MEISFPGGRKVYSDYKGFTIKTDQGKADGGDGTAPPPSDLFFASLGACMGLYALDFYRKREIDPGQLKLTVELLTHEKTHMVEKMIFNMELGPEFPQKYTAALIRAMKLCYLKQHFEKPPQFEFVTNHQ
jgi:ribosomal protein S12 methylthiotransferase accessory factor